MPEISQTDRWRLGANGDGTAQLFKADKNGVLDFSLQINYESTEDRNRAELMRRSPEMLALLQDITVLWDEHGFGDDDDVSTPLHNRLRKIIKGM